MSEDRAARMTGPAAVDIDEAGPTGLISEPPALGVVHGEGGDPPEPAGPPSAVLERYVAPAVAGDERARALLLAEISPMVLRYCRARLGRQETVIGSAEDVAQDVCVAVLAALPSYTVKGLSFRAFVYGIVGHKVTDTFRAIGRNRAEPVPDVPETSALVDGPEHQTLTAELNRALSGLLSVLTERQREVLVMRVGMGLSAEETAAAVSSTPGAIRVTQHRAVMRLREIVTRRDIVEQDDMAARDRHAPGRTAQRHSLRPSRTGARGHGGENAHAAAVNGHGASNGHDCAGTVS